jgi:hypothetical protein
MSRRVIYDKSRKKVGRIELDPYGRKVIYDENGYEWGEVREDIAGRQIVYRHDKEWGEIDDYTGREIIYDKHGKEWGEIEFEEPDTTFADIIEPIIGPLIRKFVGLFNVDTYRKLLQRGKPIEREPEQEEEFSDESIARAKMVSENLIDLVKSDDTALRVSQICIDNRIRDKKKVRGIAYHASRVLLGSLPPEEFQKTLQEKVGLPSHLAEKISRQINESIFYPVKDSLNALYSYKPMTDEDFESECAELRQKFENFDEAFNDWCNDMYKPVVFRTKDKLYFFHPNYSGSISIGKNSWCSKVDKYGFEKAFYLLTKILEGRGVKVESEEYFRRKLKEAYEEHRTAFENK